MDLLIDIGNTNLRWATLEGDPPAGARPGPTLGEVHTLRHHGALPIDLLAAWDRLPAPRKVLVGNVGGAELAAHLTRAVRSLWGLDPGFAATRAEGFGVRVAYAEPLRLGVDRWLALIAVHRHAPGPSLVIDAGTAITYDLLLSRRDPPRWAYPPRRAHAARGPDCRNPHPALGGSARSGTRATRPGLRTPPPPLLAHRFKRPLPWPSASGCGCATGPAPTPTSSSPAAMRNAWPRWSPSRSAFCPHWSCKDWRSWPKPARSLCYPGSFAVLIALNLALFWWGRQHEVPIEPQLPPLAEAPQQIQLLDEGIRCGRAPAPCRRYGRASRPGNRHTRPTR